MVTNMAEPKADLLLDGYISQTLTPRYTEKYLRLFIKCLEKEHRGSFVAFHDGWVVARSRTAARRQQQQKRRATTKSTPGNRSRARARASPPPPLAATRAPRPQLNAAGADDADDDDDADIDTDYEYEMFDRKADLCVGTIVPQPTWIGVTEKTGVLCPIFFVRRDGALGVPYEYPPPERSSLHNATATAPALLRRRNQNMQIRIKWPGYEEFHYEFRILDRKLGQHVPITMSRLVERVMRGIHRLYLEDKRDPKTFKERWKLGDGGVQPNEISIVGLIHISKGTWMPILQLGRHIIPRWDWEQNNLSLAVSQKQSEEYTEE